MRKLIALFLLLLCTSVLAQDAPKLEFEKYRLPNGLEVILHVDRKLPIVHVNQWFHVGSKNEKRGRTGFAHLFEHMMFQGSKNMQGDYWVNVENIGANVREGGVNGTTDSDRTNYFVTAPAGSLEYLLWLEADRLATLADITTQVRLDNQRDVVKNERRQRFENTPYGRWYKLAVENLFPAEHPYSWTAIGSHEDLTAATLDDVTEFFRTYYAPNNLSLVIAGDFDPAEAKRLVAKYFGPIPPGPALDRPARAIPVLGGEKIIDAYDRVPQERVYMLWPAPEYFAPGEAELELASTILADGLSSRLSKVLIHDRQIASDVTAFLASGEISGFFCVIATARPGTDLPELERVISAEIARLAKDGPTAAELQRAKTKYRYGVMSGLERIGGFGGKADLLNQYNTYLGDPGKLREDLDRHTAAPADAVRAATARWIDTPNRLLIRFHPEQSQRPAETVDRSKVPAMGTDRPFAPPAVQTATLENGLSLFVVERHELPKLGVTLATRAGSIHDPQAKSGLANMVLRTIDKGTKSLSGLEIEERLGDLGTTLVAGIDREASGLTLDLLKSSLDPALGIVADVVLNPTFPAAEVDRERNQQLDQLSQAANNANAVAARLRPMLLFGPDHPYARPLEGLPSGVKSITRDDLVKFHADRWKPGSSALIFVGDISLDEAKALARKHFGRWSGGAAPAIAIPEPHPAPSGKIYVFDRPDAAQTVVAQILPAPARKSPDYDALQLADAVWGGGGVTTRLNTNIREQKGYSYGIFSAQNLLSRAGMWWAGGGVQTGKTKEALVEFFSELNGLAGAHPITEKELTGAKLTLVRGYSQQFESHARIAGEIAGLWTLGLPMTELERAPSGLTNTTLAATNAAAKKYAVPDRSILLLVGDLSKIGPGLQELNAGEIVVLDAEGKKVAR